MSTFSDVNLTLQPHPGTKDVLKKLDVEAVKSSMKNILFSGPYDSPFNANYGANLRSLLFENMSPGMVALAKRRIMLSLAEFEPRVVVDDIYVGGSDDSELKIGILFNVIGNQQQQTLNLVLERIR